jgi:hypothetical protein
MTREIPVTIISPLVTGTGPPIIFDLHGLQDTRNQNGVRWSGDNVLAAEQSIRQGRTDQFVSKLSRGAITQWERGDPTDAAALMKPAAEGVFAEVAGVEAGEQFARTR